MPPVTTEEKRLTEKYNLASYETITNLWALMLFAVGLYVFIEYDTVVSGASLWVVAAFTSHSVYKMFLRDFDIKILRLHGDRLHTEMRKEAEIFRGFIIIVFLFIAVMTFNAAALPTLLQ